jgi:hypothetical protein
LQSKPGRLWKLAVNADQTAELTRHAGNGRVIFSKEIPCTDFPPATQAGGITSFHSP